ncbi:2-hydroxyacyl-CoA dehydratase [Rhodovastum atsumiense]|uniref:2-hydroxyacyl-CoA dehydratase n=1 Tax=Rhodovastum atsumiense TaxID=504468 RepID=A0A5M6IUR8_9PROT|nr:2-hydroxyacyl-CoA dehydratase family protein [Rhodovastum atsumiense]KAA5611971.1 2-hydroxyacyl-CoA dehydratase [Rhodovastum atsumiense]CAH2598750.1 2-hydroxyacyl-CoA dehydratase [Rhodovastum atsumiense]
MPDTAPAIERQPARLDLLGLARIGSGADTAARATSEALESQVAYLRQTRRDHGYSPAVGRLFDLVLSYIDDAEAAARDGQRAAWVGAMAWAPIFYACDTIPISVPEVGRLGSSDAMTVAEDFFQLPKESCSMVGAVLGELFLRINRTVRRIAVYNAICEPLNVGWELLRAQGFDVFRVEAANRPNAFDTPERVALIENFLTEELHALTVWLNGEPVEDARLTVEIRRFNRVLGKIRRILDLRSRNPLYIRSLATMYLLMGSGHYFGKPEQYEAVLDALTAELESADIIPSAHRSLVRLAWFGGRGQEFGVYQTIDDMGGAITAWHTPDDWTYDIPEDVPPLQAMARHIITGLVSGSPVLRLQRVADSLPVFGATGVLLYGYVGCSFGGIHREIQSTFFQERGVPTLSLEGSFQVGPPTGQLQTRIRAFIEMLAR